MGFLRQGLDEAPGRDATLAQLRELAQDAVAEE